MAKIINHGAFVKQTQTKTSPKFLWNSFAVRTGLVTGLPLCLQRTLTPGHGESIYKKEETLRFLPAVRTGLVTGLPLCLQRTLTPGHGESIYKKEETLRFLPAVRTGLEPVTPCVTGRYSNQLN